MRNKGIITIIALLLVLSLLGTGAKPMDMISKKELDKGIVAINYSPEKNKDVKAVVTKGKVSYNYPIVGPTTNLPLQSGDGAYVVTLAEGIGGNKYKVLKQETVNLKLADDSVIYLQSIPQANWNDQMLSVKKAKELTKNAKTDLEKLNIIHNYVSSTVKYDYEKAKTIKGEYIPSAELTFSQNTGICYDYSVLTAVMLRSVGVPAKIEMGTKNDIKDYHSWNSVYLKDTKKWVLVDTTYDAILKAGNKPVTMVKNEKEYVKTKQY